MVEHLPLVVTDPNRVDIGEVPFVSFDHAHGDDENTFTLQAYADDFTTDRGGLVYVDSTEYGGIIDNKRITLDNSGARVVTYSGRTFTGILKNTTITPPPGDEWYIVAGEANSVLAEVLTYLNMGSIFTASTESSGVTMNAYAFRRFTNAYDGLRSMLSAAGAVLAMTYDHTTQRVIMSAEPRADYPELSIDEATITLESKRAYNHVIVGGTGQLEERVVVHRYADAAGNISTTQTFTGADEMTYFYDYSTADADEAVKAATQWLTEAQAPDVITIDVIGDELKSLRVGDVVHVSDAETGTEAEAIISKKIVRADALGSFSVEYTTMNLAEFAFDDFWPPIYYNPTTRRLEYGAGGNEAYRVQVGPGAYLYYGDEDEDFFKLYRGSGSRIYYVKWE